MKAMMAEHGLYCEADAEYWKAVRAAKQEIETVCMKRMPSPFGDLFWILDGKMTTPGIIQRSMMYHPKYNRIATLWGKLDGNAALDICSSYGCSARSLLTKHHTVDIIEFEDWYAKIVKANIKSWGLTDRIRVAHTRDLTHIDFTAYSSVRFGIKEVEYLFMHYAEQFLKMDTVCFEFNANNVIVETLLDEGYRRRLAYKNCDVFTKHK